MTTHMVITGKETKRKKYRRYHQGGSLWFLFLFVLFSPFLNGDDSEREGEGPGYRSGTEQDRTVTNRTTQDRTGSRKKIEIRVPG